MKTFPVFPGNCPHNVNKDAKYSVRGTDDRVGLMYSTASGETWHMTTDAHPDLADMVNDVKRTHGTAARGPFYVNEYKQVIVPAGDDVRYYYAGMYKPPLRFDFEGKTISGEPLNPQGLQLRPGDSWIGPHAGIPYVLAAAGNDVYYRTFPRPNAEKKVKLSDERSRSAAEQVARLLSTFKGSGGGRFYVNEFCSVFSPVNGTDGLRYLYIGQIDLASWFPDPMGSTATSTS